MTAAADMCVMTGMRATSIVVRTPTGIARTLPCVECGGEAVPVFLTSEPALRYSRHYHTQEDKTDD
jgi:hypothetical protein